MSEKYFLNDGWQFADQFDEAMLQNRFPSEMETVRIPHTVTEVPYSYFDESIYQKDAAYRKDLFIPQEWEGKRIELTFEGVGHQADVFVNGVHASSHSNGYSAFTVDLAPFVNFGAENTILVRANSKENLNIPPFGKVIDYMTYGGMYRDVVLEVKNQDGIQQAYFAPVFKNGMSQARIHAAIDFYRPVVDGTLNLYLEKKNSGQRRLLKKVAVRNQKLELEYPAGEVELWSPEKPNLYEIHAELVKDSQVVDSQSFPIGFRKAEFKADGFYLNDQKYKIRGLNRHQAYPYVGYAMPESMQRLDAEILKNELGLNAVRTSHYPQAQSFLNACDELGLLVFTEIPGWQHIGDEEWKKQAVANVKEMIEQNWNHPSIILWGVRINESGDDHDFYTQTNATAHELDPFRQTGGVRFFPKSELLEDVYTYNDFSHDGKTPGCLPKKKVTPDLKKGYLISEYNGHMYPTKSFDCEEHRSEHALRHARVLDAAASHDDIAGSFGWCFADYNTHKDFGSGDRVCHHGVLDMFRNHKLAADVYTIQQQETPFLNVHSSMDIGDHPGGNRGEVWMYTNADKIRMYKNDQLLKEYDVKNSQFEHLKRGPVMVDDYVGDVLETIEGFSPDQAQTTAKILNMVAHYSLTKVPKIAYAYFAKLMAKYHMTTGEVTELYNKYVGNWGAESTSYRFEAIQDGQVVADIKKETVSSIALEATTSHTKLKEANTYDVAAIRLRAVDQNGNVLPYFQQPLALEAQGEIEIIGPSVVALQGGMGGTYVKTTGKPGAGRLIIKGHQLEPVEINFEIEKEQVPVL